MTKPGSTRTVQRVEPLADPFVLPADLARGSRLHGRLVFLALPDDASAAATFDAVRSMPGMTAARTGSRLFADGVDRPWTEFRRPSDVGLGPMVSGREFLGALRGLADDLLAPALVTAEFLVEWSPEHATADSVTAMASLYPDATIVVPPALATALPAEVRTRVTVTVPVAPPPQPPLADNSANDEAGSRATGLIVVVGCGRSGTTWLEQLLLAHPDVGGVDRSESWLFQQLHPLWRNIESGTGLSSYVDRSGFTAALRRYADSIFGATLARHRPGASYVVEKTPMHSYRLREIAAVYPDAWVVHVLRDGREVARSISQVPFFNLPDPGDASEMWRRVVAAVDDDARAVPRFREVRYETLAADPVREVGALMSWIGLAVGDDVHARIHDASGERVSAHAGIAAAAGEQSWQRLPAADIAAIYRRAGRTLVEKGYASRWQVWRGKRKS